MKGCDVTSSAISKFSKYKIFQRDANIYILPMAFKKFPGTHTKTHRSQPQFQKGQPTLCKTIYIFPPLTSGLNNIRLSNAFQKPFDRNRGENTEVIDEKVWQSCSGLHLGTAMAIEILPWLKAITICHHVILQM